MTLLNEINSTRRQLKPTTTTVTHADGRTSLEIRDASGVRVVSAGAGVRGAGYVVDRAPDDRAARLVPHLFVGSQECAAPDRLRATAVTRLLSLGVRPPQHELDEIDGLVCKYIPCLDLPETDIDGVLAEALPFIQDSIDSAQNVLVHCNAGVSRTGMVAIAYLICYRNMTFDEAYELVRTERPAVRPNDGFIKQLKQLKYGEYSPTKNI